MTPQKQDGYLGPVLDDKLSKGLKCSRKAGQVGMAGGQNLLIDVTVCSRLGRGSKCLITSAMKDGAGKRASLLLLLLHMETVPTPPGGKVSASKQLGGWFMPSLTSLAVLQEPADEEGCLFSHSPENSKFFLPFMSTNIVLNVEYVGFDFSL